MAIVQVISCISVPSCIKKFKLKAVCLNVGALVEDINLALVIQGVAKNLQLKAVCLNFEVLLGDMSFIKVFQGVEKK